MGSGGGFGGAALPPPPPPQFSSIAPAGLAQEIADLFEYSIANPVTVRKDESAMLPFLQQKVSARKLIIYSDSTKPNPFSAAEIVNNTGKTLDGGPITVYDAGEYAGEALVETIKSGDKRFISYGVDLGTRIATSTSIRATMPSANCTPIMAFSSLAPPRSRRRRTRSTTSMRARKL